MERPTTKQILFLSLEELCQTQHYSKITVDQIVQNCGFKRGTFYYYFKDKDDLVQTALSDAVLKAYSQYYPTGSWLTVLEHSLTFSHEHRELLRVVHISGGWFYEELLSYVEDLLLQITAAYYKKRYNQKLTIDLHNAISFCAAGSIRLYHKWICSEKPQSVKEMAANIYACIPPSLREAFDGGAIFQEK